MNRVQAALIRIAGDLRDLGHRWALVGGLAVSVHSDPRFTRDVDVAVAVTTDAEAELLVAALQARGYRLLNAIEQTATGRLATVRLSSPGARRGGVVVDLLFASCGIEPEIVAKARRVAVLPHVSVPVARPAHLVAMKVLSLSPERRQDAIDLDALAPLLNRQERVAARQAVRLIEGRGYHRGKELARTLEELLSTGPRRR